jgi:hypothetical protein
MNDEKKTSIEIVKILSIKDVITNIQAFWNYLLTKWIIIFIFGFGGAGIGLGLSFLVKPEYTANLSFVLIDKSSATGGLASLASTFGFSGMLSSGNGSAFSGDNLLEIIKSRYAVEKTLLSTINFNGKEKTLMDAYIEFNEFKKSWKNSKNVELKSLQYPLDQKRSTYTRTQDSVILDVYNRIIKSNALTVIRKDRKLGIVNINFSSKNEQFSKSFVENLMSQTYQFYTDTRTSQSRANINMMQHTADSIKNLYENALYNSATISQININSALQTAAVPRIKQENNAQLYGSVYAEVLKNLETLKLDLARETPIVQVIDMPRYPLKEKKLGKAKGIVFGGLIGGSIILIYLLIVYYFERVSKIW